MKAEVEDITTFCALFAACMVLLGTPVALMCLGGMATTFLARVIPFWILSHRFPLSSASLLSYLCVRILRKDAHKFSCVWNMPCKLWNQINMVQFKEGDRNASNA
jgi:hypothetical protein